jgi:hypothetical protein
MATSISSTSGVPTNPSSLLGGSNTANNVQNTINDVSGAISDPFGTVISKALNGINSLTVNIEKKVDQLIKEVIQKTDSKGRVSLEGNSLVITVRREDQAQAEELKKRVTNKIESINKTISILNKLVTSLIAVQTAITLYKTVLDIQEVSLSVNPVTGPIFVVLKKGIKIIFLKEIINQYVKILGRQLLQNKQILNSLITKFRSIQVSVKVQDEAEKGNFINIDSAEKLLADDLLGTDITTDSQDFTDYKFNEYILKVEKQGEKQIIGRAYEKYSGLIKAQTAPTFTSSPEDLMEELKTILNLQS